MKVDVRRVVESLGIEVKQVYKQELNCWCPFHKEGKNTNLEVHVTSGLWHCWVCNAHGNLPKLVADRKHISYREALADLEGISGFPTVFEMKEEGLRELDKKLAGKHPRFDNFDVAPYMHGGVWWQRFAGFSKDTVDKFSLGFDSKSHRAVIPVSYKRKWVGIIERATNDSQHPKYLYNTGFRKGDLLYPWDHVPAAATACVLVEGPRDSLQMQASGVCGALAVLGSGVTANQLRLLIESFDEVTLFFDNDIAGHLSTFKVGNLLENYVRLFVAPYISGTKDPGEMTPKQIARCLKSRVSWDSLR